MIPDLSFRDEEEEDDEDDEDESEEETPVKVSVSMIICGDLWLSLNMNVKLKSEFVTGQEASSQTTDSLSERQIQHTSTQTGTCPALPVCSEACFYLALTEEHKVHWGDQAPPLPECISLDKHV